MFDHRPVSAASDALLPLTSHNKRPLRAESPEYFVSSTGLVLAKTEAVAGRSHTRGWLMSQSVSRAVREMTATAHSLPTLITPEDVGRAGAALLLSVLGADDILLTRLDVAGGRTIVGRGPDLRADAAMADGLARHGLGHPAVRSYLIPGDDGRPRCVSDVVPNREFWSCAAYSEIFRQAPARYQLSCVTGLAGAVGTGWVLMRAASDFSAEEVDTAALMLPMLTTLGELARSRSRTGPPPDWGLTHGEQAVLDLLATGLSGRAMGRRLGITESTVRKHLSRIYCKLGVHDRLSATLCLQAASYRPAGGPQSIEDALSAPTAGDARS